MALSGELSGINAGSIALMCGIYQRLFSAFSTIFDAFFLALQFKFKKALQQLDTDFLIPLLLGFISASLSLTFLLKWGLKHYPEFSRSIIFGMMEGGFILILIKIRDWNISKVMLLIIGALTATFLLSHSPQESLSAWSSLFFTGMNSATSCFLPGLSSPHFFPYPGIFPSLTGIYISLSERSDGSLLPPLLGLSLFLTGVLTGCFLLCFLISYLFKFYDNFILAILSGLFLGSLYQLWPFRVLLSYYENEGLIKIVEDRPVLPYFNESLTWWCFFLMIFFFMLVVTLGRTQKGK